MILTFSSLVCLDAVIKRKRLGKSRAWVEVVVGLDSVSSLVSLAVAFDHSTSYDTFSKLTAGW